MRGRLDLLYSLESRLEEMKEDVNPSNLPSENTCESAKERVQWALTIVKEQLVIFEALLVDLRIATESVSGIKGTQICVPSIYIGTKLTLPCHSSFSSNPLNKTS